MADKLGLGNDVHELRIGQSFLNPHSTAFHSVRYDFKPASVDTNKKATVDVGNNHQVTVTVPHLDGAGTPQTVFKGSQRPYTKECVLIIDKVTGQITLEKLSSNIQLKKTRSEFSKPVLPGSDREPERPNNYRPGSAGSNLTSGSNLSSRSQTPPIGQRVSGRTKVTSGSRRPDRPITHLVPKHSPLHASPSYPSPGHHVRSPKRELPSVNNESSSQSTLASLPLISLDDYSDPAPPAMSQHTMHSPQNFLTDKPSANRQPAYSADTNPVGEMSDSSSSSSDSDSDSDNTDAPQKQIITKTNGHTNGLNSPKINTHLLKEDLCLSESGSDSD